MAYELRLGREWYPQYYELAEWCKQNLGKGDAFKSHELPAGDNWGRHMMFGYQFFVFATQDYLDQFKRRWSIS